MAVVIEMIQVVGIFVGIVVLTLAMTWTVMRFDRFCQRQENRLLFQILSTIVVGLYFLILFALAVMLRRYLAGEPVVPSPSYFGF